MPVDNFDVLVVDEDAPLNDSSKVCVTEGLSWRWKLRHILHLLNSQKHFVAYALHITEGVHYKANGACGTFLISCCGSRGSNEWEIDEAKKAGCVLRWLVCLSLLFVSV